MPVQHIDGDTLTGLLLAIAVLITALTGFVAALATILVNRQKTFQQRLEKNVNGIVEKRVESAKAEGHAQGHAEGIVHGIEKSWREGGSSKKVLIVDDDKMIVELYRVLLETAGYLVFCAYSGLEGLQKVQATRPDVILLDWKMPCMAGDEVLKWIQEVTSAPIIVISGAFLEHDKIEGVTDLLVKPVEPRVLLTRVGALFKERIPVVSPIMVPVSDVVVQTKGAQVTIIPQVPPK